MEKYINPNEKIELLRSRSRLTIEEFCEKYGIPYNTYISWTRITDRKSCPAIYPALIEKVVNYESYGTYDRSYKEFENYMTEVKKKKNEKK